MLAFDHHVKRRRHISSQLSGLALILGFSGCIAQSGGEEDPRPPALNPQPLPPTTPPTEESRNANDDAHEPEAPALGGSGSTNDGGAPSSDPRLRANCLGPGSC